MPERSGCSRTREAIDFANREWDVSIACDSRRAMCDGSLRIVFLTQRLSGEDFTPRKLFDSGSDGERFPNVALRRMRVVHVCLALLPS